MRTDDALSTLGRFVLHNTIVKARKTAVEPTAQAYGELRLAFKVFNERLFDSTLPSPLITLQREPRTCGYFSNKRFVGHDGVTTDEIALNPEYFACVPLVEVLATLLHEMVHLWQAHFGRPGRGRYHNAEFARKMIEVGLMPSSTGHPGGSQTGDQMSDYPIEGGRFLQVVDYLVRELDFSITWYDRVTPMPAAPSHVAAMVGLPAAAVTVPADNGVAVVRRPTAGDGDGTVQANTKPGRHKYQCPKCKANAWARPNLRIRCMDCGKQFKDLEVG